VSCNRHSLACQIRKLSVANWLPESGHFAVPHQPWLPSTLFADKNNRSASFASMHALSLRPGRGMVKEKIVNPDGIEAFLEAQTPERRAICRRLVSEIRRCLPKSTARLYHGSPAWFIGENAVLGVSVKAKAGVTLLFWNGQAFKDQALIPVGQFKAAQLSFQAVDQINTNTLRRSLKKAGADI
jgi:Domain of unknown function (DU1801)